jgi:hypothetical protein
MAESDIPSKQRRSPRIKAAKLVDVEWKRGDGLRIREPAETEVVSAHGAMLRLRARIHPNTEIILRQLSSRQAVPARVVHVLAAGSDGLPRIGIELASPNETFWGVEDRRAAPRFEMRPETFAYFYPADEESTGHVRNLSLGGVYIEDKKSAFAEGSEVQLELKLDDESLTLRGQVTRTYPNKGFALRFLDYSTELKDWLERYLRNLDSSSR